MTHYNAISTLLLILYVLQCLPIPLVWHRTESNFCTVFWSHRALEDGALCEWDRIRNRWAWSVSLRRLWLRTRHPTKIRQACAWRSLPSARPTRTRRWRSSFHRLSFSDAELCMRPRRRWSLRRTWDPSAGHICKRQIIVQIRKQHYGNDIVETATSVCDGYAPSYDTYWRTCTSNGKNGIQNPKSNFGATSGLRNWNSDFRFWNII